MTALANNVILFPRRGPERQAAPTSIDEVIDSVDTVRQVHIQESLEAVVPMLFDKLSLAGFAPEDELEYIKDGALVVEAIRSFLSKIYGMSHPLQMIAEHLFEQVDDEGNLEVSDKIKLIITPTEGQG